MYTYEDIKNAKGNVFKVALGKRIVYLTPINIGCNSILCYQVDKNGNILYTKWSKLKEYTIRFNQIKEILEIYAETL